MLINFERKFMRYICTIVIIISIILVFFALRGFSRIIIKADSPIEISLPDEEYFLPEENSFNIVFTAETEAIPFSPTGNGTVWKRGHDFTGTATIEGKAAVFDYVLVNPLDFGKTGIVYTNVGNFEDRRVHLIVTIMNVHNNKPVGFSVEKEISFLNDSFVEFKWTYVDADTYEPINLSGYYTFSDLDVNQEIMIKDASYITAMYRSSDTEHYKVYQVGDGIRISANSPNLGVADKRGFITLIYTDLPELGVIWNGTRNTSADLVSFSNSTNEELFDLNASKNPMFDEVASMSGIGYNNLFLFTQYQPAKTTLLTPTKSETHTDNQFIKYKISHSLVYEEDILRKYEEFTIVDEVDNKLDIISSPSEVVITNEFDEDKSSLFDVSIVGNTITISAKKSELSKNSFYGHTYTYIFDTKIKEQFKNDINDTYAIKNEINVSRKVPYSSEEDLNVSNEVVVNAAYVLTKFVDTNGNQLVNKNGVAIPDAASILQKGLVSNNYTTSSKNFVGWTLVGLPANASGVYTDSQQEVVYVYTRELYDVYFVENGGTNVDDRFDLDYGSLISSENTDTYSEGNTFVGWYRDAELTIPWDFNNDVIDGDITLYAKWIKSPPPIPNTGVSEECNGYIILLSVTLVVSGVVLVGSRKRYQW